MISKTKSVGIALAVMALGMAFASAAHAAQVHATSGANTTITGSVTAPEHLANEFHTVVGTTKCQTSEFEGTIPGAGGQAQQTTTKEIELTGRYTGCTAFGLATTIDMNGCKYRIKGTHGVTGATTAGTAYVDITGCTSPTGITITALGGCSITVPETAGNTNLSHIVLTNKGTPGQQTEHLTADITVSGITYETHGPCPNAPTPTILRHNGQYTGSATFKGFQDQGQEQKEHNGHKYQVHKHNNVQVGLFVT